MTEHFNSKGLGRWISNRFLTPNNHALHKFARLCLFPPSSLLLLSEASSSLLPQLTKQCKRPQHPGNGSLKPKKSRRNGKIRTCFKANPEPYGKGPPSVGSDSEKHDTVTDSPCEWTDFQSYLCSMAQLYPMAAYSVPYLNYVYHRSLTETDFNWKKAASGMFICSLSLCLFLACKLLMLRRFSRCF